MEAKVEETLFQMMAGACEVLAESGCSLAGGHTCEGSEQAPRELGGPKAVMRGETSFGD
jgi:hypothetical protein